MLATRLHLLSAFGFGCLCTAVLVVVVARPDQGAPVPSDASAPAVRALEAPAPPSPPAPVAPKEEARVDAPPSNAAPVAPTDAGRSLSEILARLEAEYREGLRPAPLADASELEPSSKQAPEPLAPVLAAVAATAPAPAPVAPRADDALPPAPASPTVAQPPAAPALAVLEDARLREQAAQARRAREAYERDLYAANLYAAELYRQQQQLAMLEYLALIAQSSAGKVGPSGPTPRRAPQRRSPTFSFPLTNPNNPWGFEQPPTVLVK
jgi:hypothetical protein